MTRLILVLTLYLASCVPSDAATLWLCDAPDSKGWFVAVVDNNAYIFDDGGKQQVVLPFDKASGYYAVTTSEVGIAFGHASDNAPVKLHVFIDGKSVVLECR